MGSCCWGAARSVPRAVGLGARSGSGPGPGTPAVAAAWASWKQAGGAGVALQGRGGAGVPLHLCLCVHGILGMVWCWRKCCSAFFCSDVSGVVKTIELLFKSGLFRNNFGLTQKLLQYYQEFPCTLTCIHKLIFCHIGFTIRSLPFPPYKRIFSL